MNCGSGADSLLLLSAGSSDSWGRTGDNDDNNNNAGKYITRVART